MNYQEIVPHTQLLPYVKCFFIRETYEFVEFEARILPGGYPELIFNLSDIYLHSDKEKRFNLTPPIDYLGQLTRPMDIKSKGKITMIGIRFYAHATAYFLRERIEQLNDQVSDLTGLLHSSVTTLHTRLLETSDLADRVTLIEAFLFSQLARNEKRFDQINLVGDVTRYMARHHFHDPVAHVAAQSGFSSRYLQKLFLQYTGLTPKSFLKINRFRNSLNSLENNNESLSSIAYDCGYFDQSHFIKEFKSFTGQTPHEYRLART